MIEQQHGQGENLIVVYRAPNEVSANIILGLLQSEGIPAITESRMVANMDGIFVSGEGLWGNVVVPEIYVSRSRELIEAYESAPALDENMSM